MESGEAEAVELQPKTKERRIDPNRPYRINGPTRVRFGANQFLAIPNNRPADGGGLHPYLLLYPLDSNGNLERVDGEPKREWLEPGATIGRGEGNSVTLPEGNLLASRN